MNKLKEILERTAKDVEASLREYEKKIGGVCGTLDDAMVYSLEAGGKRIRPFLCLEFCKLFGGSPEHAMPFACAIELVHTYSLIHDDLPCMDDDDLRRGKPTNHKVFGEATALLAGDALLTEAFELLAAYSKVDSYWTCRAVQILASRAGSCGMVAGQQIDLNGEKTSYSRGMIEKMIELKTGKLLEAACLLGCCATNGKADEKAFEAASIYAMRIGEAFQIIDDILDVTGDEKLLGKTIGSDAENQKSTVLSYLTIEEAFQKASILTQEACSALQNYPENEMLVTLAHYLLERKH